MIEIKNYPNNRDEFVGAEQLMKFLHGRTSGVFSLADSAAVTAKQNQMAVRISDGYGWIANGEGNGCAWWVDAMKSTGAPAELAISAADGTLSRIDRVVVSWETADYTQHPYLMILKGANSSNPQPPALTNNSTTRQISLAQVRVNAGALKITSADITDERLDPAVCGLVTYSEKIPTEVIQAQFTDLLNLLKSQIDQTASGALPDGSVTKEKLAKSLLDVLGTVRKFAGYAPDASGNIVPNKWNLDENHPVGSLWISKNPTSPAERFGGTWERQEGIFILGASSKYPVGSTGGESTHTLKVDEIPSHTPSISTEMYCLRWQESHGYHFQDAETAKGWSRVSPTFKSIGGGKAHNNMSPYKAYYIWERIA